MQTSMQVGKALAMALASRREDCNNRFQMARRQRPQLDGKVVLDWLAQVLDPVVQASGLEPRALDELVMTAFDASLELAGQRLIGAGEGHELLAEGWRQLLPGALRLLGMQPAQALAAISNALIHLRQAPQTRPQFWLQTLARLTSLAPDADSWLACGQVLAWRSGLAQYRSGALQLLRHLPDTLARVVLGLTPRARLGPALDALEKNLWFDPAAASQPTLRLVHRLGGFRGFGGVFARPPTVAALGEQLYVSSGDACWQVLADACGWFLHRVSAEEFLGASADVLPAGLKIEGELVRHGALTLSCTGFGGISASAATSQTLALSFHASHSISILALP